MTPSVFRSSRAALVVVTVVGLIYAWGMGRRQWNLLAVMLFLVGCGGPGEPDTGRLRVTVTTTGSPADPDGYSLALNDGVPTAIAVTAEREFEDLTPGEYTVTLGGLAGNCSVADDNPRFATVAGGRTASAAFTVTCGPLVGTLRITTITEGTPVDPDGYLVRVDAGAVQAIAANGSLEIPDLPIGDRTVQLDGVWAYCAFPGTETGISTQVQPVALGTTVDVRFTLTCRPALRNRIVFFALRGTNAQIYAIRPDGTGDTRISHNPTSPAGSFLDVSKDGTKLVHVTGGPEVQHLETFTSLGEPLGEVVTGIACPTTPGMSLDGSRLALVNCPDGALRVIDTDGSNEMGLTGQFGYSPAWTPDGNRIVFSRIGATSGSLAIIDADGANLLPLTSTPEELVIDPAVSPDGTKVAFGRVLPTVPSTTDLYVINIDGTGERLLLHGEAYHSNPSWSPDGSKIVFAQDLPSGLFIIDASGGDPSTLVLNPSSIAWPTWTW
jgi:hypothetical protein